MSPAENEIRKELSLDVPEMGHKNYSVKAGAGGGKTTLLSRRIANQIIKGIPIESFVIITYTNAAAEELREKITNRLQEIIKSGVLPEKELTYATKALNSIELMQISTIHAFLFKILREYAFESGIAMDARMLEEAEDKARKKNFYDKWYREHFDEIEKFKDDWIYDAGNGTKSEHHREVLENMFNDIANVREEIVFDVSDHTADFEKYADKYVRRWLQGLINFKTELQKNRPLKKDGDPYKLSNGPQSILDNISKAEGTTSNSIVEAQCISNALAAMKKIIDKGESFYGARADSTPLLGVLPTYPTRELEWNFSKLYENFFAKAQKASKVAEYVCRIQKAHQQEIDAETLVLSNDDILYRAEKLLVEHNDILEKVRDRYSKIYVDEFQDTTGLQTRIIELISEKKGADLSKIDLADDKLLVVGDSKQSIYRFTGAEKNVYDEVDKLMDTLPDTSAESVSLESNFRSNSKIVDWVNTSFNGSTTGSPHGLMKDYTEMSADWKVTETNALHGVYRYGDIDSVCTKEEDVKNVVELVKTLVNNPKYFIERVSRNGDGGFNPPVLCEIQYSDIMIICRNTTHIDSYVEAFSAAEIPVNVQGKFKINGDEVLRNFVLLVEYFAEHKNKKNRVTAAQILYGIDVAKVDKSVLKAAEDDLRNMRIQFREKKLDAAAIVSQLLSHEEYFVPKGKLHEVDRVRSYRIRLHQMVETCLAKNNGDLTELVSKMNDYMSDDVRREIPLESNENAIRLMNAHQSKGLTGQIVIIADRSANEECRYSGFRKDGKYYPVATYKYSSFSDVITVPTYGFDFAMLNQVYDDEMEEGIRLEYVAATRAAHALIVMPVATSRNVPWFTDKAYGLDKMPDIIKWLDDRNNDTAVYPVTANASSTSHTVINLQDLSSNLASANIDELSKAQITSITPSGLEAAGVTGFKPTDEGYVKESRPKGNVFGTVMHRVYELIFNRYMTISTLSPADQEKAIERIINQAVLEQADEMHADDDPKEFVDFLKPVMMDYLTKVVAPIIAEADEIYPEYTFSFYVSDSEKEQFLNDFDKYLKTAKDETDIAPGDIWVNGQADLVVRKKDGIIKVYDYKSDSMNGKALTDFEKSMADKYEGQLALYKYAIGKAFEVADVETELIHLYI